MQPRPRLFRPILCYDCMCSCDPDFSGPYCVPDKPLPMQLQDDFNADEPDHSVWKEIYGGDTSKICGHLVSGNALVFHKVRPIVLKAVF